MSNFDRFKGSIAQVVKMLLGPIDYYGLYPCKVVKQRADYTLDLKPDNPRIAAPVQVPIRTIPGIRVKVEAGTRVLLGFEGASPSAPYAMLFEHSGATIEIQLEASKVYLGSTIGTEPAAKGQTLETYLTLLKTAFDTHTHVVANAVPVVPGAVVTVTPLPLSPTVPNVKADKVDVN